MTSVPAATGRPTWLLAAPLPMSRKTALADLEKWRAIWQTELSKHQKAVGRFDECMCEGDIMLSWAWKLPEHGPHWKAANNRECQSLVENGVIRHVSRMPGMNVLRSVWYKGKVIVKGKTQRRGIKYKETHSPVLVATAFLNADIDVPTFMAPIEGYEQYPEDGSLLVIQLEKSFYGFTSRLGGGMSASQRI
ncbi:hypothetical protein DFJ73DRAFT_762586 [Zopfochytrium polystomum]|nr:hypothetical protein DFJ73DRAFT_762586 [Zopfochytrium polystomum]